MHELLRYLYVRATTTKSWRAYNSAEEIPRYNTVTDLTAVTTGRCLIFALLVIPGVVVKSGPSVLISVCVAVIINFVTGLCFAELRSRFARVQTTPYQYTYFASGGLTAFCMGSLEVLKHAMCASAVAKTTSVYIDILSGMSIRNFTASQLHTTHCEESCLDFLAFALMLAIMMFVFLAWYKQFVKLELFYKCIVGFLLLVLLFMFGVGVSNIKFSLWSNAPLNPVTVFRDAGIILLALSPTHSLFSLSDFVWLGIKPTVLVSYTVSTLFTPLLLCLHCALLTLLSPWQQWSTGAVAVEAYHDAGITWLKYVIGPMIVICLPPIGVQHFITCMDTVQDMAFDGLIPCVFKRATSSKLPSFLATGLIGLGTAFIALSVSTATLLQLAALCVIIQQVYVCCLVIIVRYKPSYHMHVVSNAHREDSNLIGQNVNHKTEIDRPDHIGDYLYGAFSNNNDESSMVITNNGGYHGDDCDDIDDLVQEYRLQSAVQCYQSALQTRMSADRTPNKHSFKCVKTSVILFTAISFIDAITVTQGWHKLETLNVGMILWLVVSMLVAMACLILTYLQPKDKILPRTMLVQAPAACAVTMAAITCLAVLSSTQAVVTWYVCVSWLCAGLLCYLLHCIHTRGASNDVYHNLAMDTDPRGTHNIITLSTQAHDGILSSTQTDDEECTFTHKSVTSPNDLNENSDAHVTRHDVLRNHMEDDDKLMMCETQAL